MLTATGAPAPTARAVTLPADVTVLLGTRFSELEHHGTRWRAVLTRWVADERIRSLTVVDFPRFRPAPPSVTAQPSWLAGARCLRVTVPGRNPGGLGEATGWLLAARSLRRAHQPAADRAVTIAATPLWAPLAARLAGRRGFDAVDDWRGLASMQQVRGRIERGYQQLPQFDAVSAVSAELAGRLGTDYGTAAVHIANGVDLASFAAPATAPAGLPDQPFAVYVGSVERRVDIDLLLAVARAVPVVVAGPADAAAATALRDAAVTWLGPIDVLQVPGLLQRAHVGLLPHRVDDFTASMDPMKLLEYLAAGLTVVSTPLAALPATGRIVTASSPTDFVSSVRRLLGEPRNATPDPVVLDRDWGAVATRLLALHLGTAG